MKRRHGSFPRPVPARLAAPVPLLDSGLFAASLIAAVFLAGCTSVKQNYMDHLETRYLQVRALAEKIPPALDIRVRSVSEREIPGPAGAVPVRIYTPLEVRENAPLIMYIHGGGFVLGSYTHVDRITRTMARDTGSILVSVNYRLAPENPYPAGLEDCLAAFDWLTTHAPDEFGIPGNRIVIAGESAGGNLSAVVSQKRRDRGQVPPLAQLLYSPLLGAINPDTGKPWASRSENAAKSVLTPKSLASFSSMYLGDPAQYGSDPSVNPLRATNFRGLPPALVTTCALDPLRDEGEAYAKSLETAGVRVVHREFPGQDHAWMGDEVMKLTADFVRSL